ncbi:hypothetical protein [Streptococcus massiliensis]|uniref:Uncharacterized protein n=1 Tax=Streptococcus massiliensis TaxID=313439 RepID=A0A380L0T0_9STRE|nr:hypothetical protein [Streptococcus massiliensis]SUN77392.1 Uncharacterised protein [Streptococcus massiliensis]
MRELFSFKGTWRTYQQEVLKQSQEFLKDGKFHLVAAPALLSVAFKSNKGSGSGAKKCFV